jgi:hypothetical protein
MTPVVDVRDWWVLHVTHLDNLPSIVASGALACDWQARQSPMRTEARVLPTALSPGRLIAEPDRRL